PGRPCRPDFRLPPAGRVPLAGRRRKSGRHGRPGGLRSWAVDGHQADRPGTELAGAFYREVIAPLIGAQLPRRAYPAGRVGPGSDVLGLDDARSRDHDWGLRLSLLVDEAD